MLQVSYSLLSHYEKCDSSWWPSTQHGDWWKIKKPLISQPRYEHIGFLEVILSNIRGYALIFVQSRTQDTVSLVVDVSC